METVVVYEWPTHFLRDDQAEEICEYERYSLFQKEPYQRLLVLSGRKEWAIEEAGKIVGQT